MLRALTGTVNTAGGGTLQSGMIRFTPLGTMPTNGGAALAPIPKVFSVTDGVIAPGSIDGGVEYLVEVFDGNLRAIYPDFTASIADTGTDITWGDLYASANVYVPVGLNLSDYVDSKLNLAKGAAGGIAALDASAVVPLGQLPDVVKGGLQIVGEWDATLNDPALASGVGTKGYALQVSVAGSTALDDVTSWAVGDIAVFDGTEWRKIGGNAGGGSGDMTKAAYDSNSDNKVNAADVADEAKAAQAGSALRTELDANQADIAAMRLASTDTFDLDAMPAAYDTWLTDNSLADSDAHRLQWVVDRLLLSDDGLTAVERDIRVLVGTRVYDVTDAAFQETGTLGSHVFGTLYGACAQILLPATGSLKTKKLLTLTLTPKAPSTLAYSVVNGDANLGNVLHTNAVIQSDATPPAGEGGNYTIIGASRALDGYANVHLSLINVINEGVTLRATGGLTGIDLSYCASMGGSHWKADVGVTSENMAANDPRRDSAGGSFTTGETEIEYRKRSHGIRTPLLWNGGRMHVGLVEVMGYRYGIDHNEHVVIGNIFANYCYAAVKLRGMSHTGEIHHVDAQRCPIWFEAPEAGDYNGEATSSLLRVGLAGGEAYHPGQFGNVGDRWYNHVSRIWDPSGLWAGEITIYESPSEPTSSWPTLPSGHGANLYLRRLGESPSGGGAVDSVNGDTGAVTVDATPTRRLLSIASGATTITPPSHVMPDRAKLIVDEDTALTLSGIADGDDIDIVVAQSGASHAVTWADAPDGFTYADEGTLGSFGTVDDHVDLVRIRVRDTLIVRTVVSLGTIAGYTSEGGGAGFTLTTLSANTWLYAFDANTGVWDAASGGTEVTGVDASAIGRIVDLVDGSVAAAQATSSAKPTLRTGATPNGKAAAEFAGDDYLAFTLEAAQGLPWTLVAYVKHTDPNTASSERFIGALGTAARLRQVSDSTGGSVPANYRYSAGAEGGAGAGYMVSGDYAIGSWHVVTVTFSQGAGGVSSELRIDGVQVATNFVGNAIANGATAYLGVSEILNRFFIGRIAFWGVQAGANATDIANTKSDLVTFYG